MGRDLNPKCKYCRREGVKLFLKGDRCFSGKCALVKRNYPPGVHGPKRLTRLTVYGRQLREKQKLKRMYGLLEKQLKLYFQKSIKQKGETGDNLVRLLEMRLDNVVYRLGFAKSRATARQLVNHGHFLVNGKKVNIPSYQVKVGDVVSLKPSSKDLKIFVNLEKQLNKKETPEWLLPDPTKLAGKVVAVPSKDDLKQIFDIKAVVEFYSR